MSRAGRYKLKPAPCDACSCSFGSVLLLVHLLTDLMLYTRLHAFRNQTVGRRFAFYHVCIFIRCTTSVRAVAQTVIFHAYMQIELLVSTYVLTLIHAFVIYISRIFINLYFLKGPFYLLLIRKGHFFQHFLIATTCRLPVLLLSKISVCFTDGKQRTAFYNRPSSKPSHTHTKFQSQCLCLHKVVQ